MLLAIRDGRFVYRVLRAAEVILLLATANDEGYAVLPTELSDPVVVYAFDPRNCPAVKPPSVNVGAVTKLLQLANIAEIVLRAAPPSDDGSLVSETQPLNIELVLLTLVIVIVDSADASSNLEQFWNIVAVVVSADEVVIEGTVFSFEQPLNIEDVVVAFVIMIAGTVCSMEQLKNVLDALVAFGQLIAGARSSARQS